MVLANYVGKPPWEVYSLHDLVPYLGVSPYKGELHISEGARFAEDLRRHVYFAYVVHKARHADRVHGVAIQSHLKGYSLRQCGNPPLVTGGIGISRLRGRRQNLYGLFPGAAHLGQVLFKDLLRLLRCCYIPVDRIGPPKISVQGYGDRNDRHIDNRTVLPLAKGLQIHRLSGVGHLVQFLPLGEKVFRHHKFVKGFPAGLLGTEAEKGRKPPVDTDHDVPLRTLQHQRIGGIFEKFLQECLLPGKFFSVLEQFSCPGDDLPPEDHAHQRDEDKGTHSNAGKPSYPLGNMFT